MRSAVIRGAFTLAVGSLVAKIIGAFYKIPLTNVIGGYGIGLYQMAYPFFCLFLIFCSGASSTVSKLVSEREKSAGKAVVKACLRLFVPLGGAGTLIMLVLAYPYSGIQGEKSLFLGYLFLAPSVLFYAVLSVFRGYFYGRQKMFASAFSEVVEQTVKVSFGLFVAYLYRTNAIKAVNLLLLCVTVSEFVALVILLIFYKKDVVSFENSLQEVQIPYAREILRKYVLPVTLSSSFLPLTTFLESVILVRLMTAYAGDAVSLYGLYAGCAVSVVNLPVGVCHAVSVSGLPAVSSAKDKRETVFSAFSLTAVCGAVSTLGLFAFARIGVNVVFGGLSSADKETLVSCIRLLSLSAVLLPCTETFSACLTGLGKAKYGTVSIAFGCVVRLALDFLLVGVKNFSVYGACISADIGYLVAFLFGLMYNFLMTGGGNALPQKEKKENDHCRRAWQ